MHGLGDSGHGWAESFRELAVPNCKMIFPHAYDPKLPKRC